MPSHKMGEDHLVRRIECHLDPRPLVLATNAAGAVPNSA